MIEQLANRGKGCARGARGRRWGRWISEQRQKKTVARLATGDDAFTSRFHVAFQTPFLRLPRIKFDKKKVVTMTRFELAPFRTAALMQRCWIASEDGFCDGETWEGRGEKVHLREMSAQRRGSVRPIFQHHIFLTLRPTRPHRRQQRGISEDIESFVRKCLDCFDFFFEEFSLSFARMREGERKNSFAAPLDRASRISFFPSIRNHLTVLVHELGLMSELNRQGDACGLPPPLPAAFGRCRRRLDDLGQGREVEEERKKTRFLLFAFLSLSRPFIISQLLFLTEKKKEKEREYCFRLAVR